MPMVLQVIIGFAILAIVVRFMWLSSNRKLQAEVQRRARARETRATRAEQLGLIETSGRPGLVDLRLRLFTKGDTQSYGPGFERPSSDPHGEAVIVQYAHGVTSYDEEQQREVTHYTKYTVAARRLGFRAHRTSIGTESLLSRAGRLIGQRDIEIESASFNRRFRVTSDNERFAIDLLDQRVAGTMLLPGIAAKCELIELLDDKVFFVADRLTDDEMFDFFEWTDEWAASLSSTLADRHPPTS